MKKIKYQRYALILFLLDYMCTGNGWKFIYHSVYLSFYLGVWNYVCLFCLCFSLHIFFSVMIMCVRLREGENKMYFPSCRSYLRRPNDICSPRHIITSNNCLSFSKNNLSYRFFLFRMLFTRFIHGSSQLVMTFIFLQGNV